MSSPMLQAVAPEALAARGEVLEGHFPLSAARRLAQFVRESLATCSDPAPPGWEAWPVHAELRFGFVRAGDGRALPAVRGRAEVTLPSTCDRCLGLMELVLAANIDYVLPDSEAEATTLEGFDVWVVGDRGLKPLDLVEEELLLSLPLAKSHDAGCPEVGVERPRAGNEETSRPFGELRTLMGGDKEQGG